MPSVEVQKIIAAEPGRVFRVATDVASIAETMSGVDSVEVLTEGPVGEGTRWRETRTMYGKKATEEMWVTGFDPPRSFVVEAASHGAHYRSEFTFEPDGEGTRLTLVFEARPVSRLARLLSFLTAAMMNSVRKLLEQDMEDVKRVAESSA